MDELEEFESPPSLLVQCIPGYDVYRLTWVLYRGYTPTRSEVIFGAVDAVFTAWDVFGLLKSAAKAGAKAAGKATAEEIAEQVAEQTSKRMAAKAGREAAESTIEWAKRGTLDLLASSPRFLRESIEERSIGRIRGAVRVADQIGWWAHSARRSAQYLRIPISVSIKVAKVFAREWTLGYGSAKALEVVATLATESPTTEVVAEKTLQCLQWLERPIR